MDIAEVVNRESLRKYLDGISRSKRYFFASRVAWRSAARVAPIAIYDGLLAGGHNDVDSKILPLFGALALSNLSNGIPPPRISGSAAAGVAGVVKKQIRTTSNNNANGAISCAAEAIGAKIASVPNAEAVVSYAANCGFSDEIWHQVRSDLKDDFFDSPPDFDPIWEKGAMPFEILNAWGKCELILSRDKDVDWGFWITFYERLLDGKDTYPDFVAPILNEFSRIDWGQKPADVNPLFDIVLTRYSVEPSQIAERIKLNEHEEYYAEPVTKLPDELRDEAVGRARDAISDFENLMRGQQSYLGAFEALTKQVLGWIEQYGDRPMRLYEKLADANEYIEDIARDCGLTKEKAVLILQRELERSRTDIRASDPVVEERINARVRVRFDEMEEASKEAFLTVIAEGAAGAEVGLQSEMTEDLPLIQDNTTPNDVRERALVREGERVIQINHLRHEAKAVEETSKTDVLVKNADKFNRLNKAGQGAWWVVSEIAKFFL